MAGESAQRIINHHRPNECTLRSPATSSTSPVPQALPRIPSPFPSIRAGKRIAEPHATCTRNQKTAREPGPSHRTTLNTLICYLPLELAATANHKHGRRTRQRERGNYRASAAAEEARGDAGRHSPESRRQRAEEEEGNSTTDLI
jgi:hypothetical protein